MTTLQPPVAIRAHTRHRSIGKHYLKSDQVSALDKALADLLHCLLQWSPAFLSCAKKDYSAVQVVCSFCVRLAGCFHKDISCLLPSTSALNCVGAFNQKQQAANKCILNDGKKIIVTNG